MRLLDRARPAAVKKSPKLPRWLAVAALAGVLSGCATVEGWFSTKKPAKDATVADPCDDDPFGDGCPCAADPKGEGCPDPCSVGAPQCADAGSEVDAGSSEVADSKAADAKAEVKDGAVASDAEQPADDIDVLSALPDGSFWDGEVLYLPDGAVVDKETLTGILDEIKQSKDSADVPTADEPDSATDQDVPDVLTDSETGGGSTDEVADSADGDDTSGTTDDADTSEPDIDTGPPPKCVTDKDCIGPAKPCKVQQCLFDAKGVAGCYYIDADNGGACDDGKACTILDHCDKGKCTGTQKFCPDGDDSVCTFPVCDELAGGCTIKFVPESPQTPCTDYNPCTDDDYCLAGKCKGGYTNKCECTKDGDCAAYEDNNLCNGTLKCKQSACVVDPTTIVVFKNGLTCDPAKDTACQINACNPINGKCELKNLPNGTACTDDNACTAGDLCIDGNCKGKDKSDTCDDKNPCTDDSCDKAVGCKFTHNSNLCDDLNPCTDLDQCNLGKCAGAAKKVCDCKSVEDCAKFEDGDLCNGTLVCSNFQCVLDPKTVVTCGPGSVCAPQICQAKTGKCEPDTFKAGVPCEDGDACTVGDACDGAAYCKPGLLVNCNDKNPCTNDTCLKNLGCVFTFANGAPCSDGESCTYPDKCKDGACQSGPNECECNTDADCEAKVAAFDKCKGAWTCVGNGVGKCKYDQFFVNPCKNDPSNTCAYSECTPATGKCSTLLQPNNSSCNDGQFCTVLDHCSNGKCVGNPNPCDDGNLCTIDTCDAKAAPATACKSDSAPLDTFDCSDGSACTSGDVCTKGVCLGKTLECDDGNKCTSDSCNVKTGCSYAPMIKGSFCNDGNPCTGDSSNNAPDFQQDGCDGQGKCAGGDPKVCAAGDACVDIPCNPTATEIPGIKQGCDTKIYLSGKPCNDGDSCTTGETCAVGLCASGSPTSCDDANACTADGCDKLKGCTHAPTAAPCDDGLVCTYGDACADGKCVGKTKTCDDENNCTADACDPKVGCVYTKGTGDCGDFAACTTDAIPKCAFKGGMHLLISEVYVGKRGDSSDDWIEIYNPSQGAAKMEDYALEVRAVDALPEDPWTVIAAGKKGTVLTPKAFMLFAKSALVQGGVTADVLDDKINLELPLAQPSKKKDCYVDTQRHLTLRIRDTVHSLEHDRVSWDDGQATKLAAGVTPADADPAIWPDYASIERKAKQNSDNSSMAPHKNEWLAGNGYDTGDDSDDFYVRFWPEPQSKGGLQYEPACNGTCAVTTRCNFDAGGEKCVNDVECKSFGVGSNPCGVGKVCQNGASLCVPDQQGGLLVSEIYFGDGGEQFVELHNFGTKPLAIGGWRLQRKDAVDEAFKPWIVQLATIPFGVVIPPKKYYVIGTQAWGRVHGQLDQVFTGNTGLDPKGGALRIWDPATDTEVDLIGWGNAKVYSNAGLDGKHLAAPAVELGQSLERKASPKSNPASMTEGGTESLAGNDTDSDADNADFIVSDTAKAQTLASGAYEPACAGTCQTGLICNYEPSNEKCVDPLCGVVCDLGKGCNPKTGACDLHLVIAEFTTDGPASKDAFGNTVFPAANEYVVLYNPSPSTIQLSTSEIQSGKLVVTEAMALQYKGKSDTSFKALTDTNITKFPLVGQVAPYSYYLIAPPNYDINLPQPDFVAYPDWGMDTEQGVIRIVRTKGTWGNVSYLDRVAWGVDDKINAESGKSTVPQQNTFCGFGIGSAVRRKALAVGDGNGLGDPFSPLYYLGAGFDSDDNSADWFRIAERAPRSQKCTWPSAPGSTKPFCVGYNIAQKP